MPSNQGYEALRKQCESGFEYRRYEALCDLSLSKGGHRGSCLIRQQRGSEITVDHRSYDVTEGRAINPADHSKFRAFRFLPSKWAFVKREVSSFGDVKRGVLRKSESHFSS